MQRRLIAYVLIFALLCSCVMTGCSSSRLKGLNIGLSDAEVQTLSEYQKYIANYEPASENAQIRIEGTAFSSCEGFAGEILKLDGVAAVATESFGSITYDFTVAQSGLYHLAIDYYPLEGYGDTIERMLYLDGELPYEEARSLIFKRQFADDGEKCYSTSGNEYRRPQKEIFQWQSTDVRSGSGYLDMPLQFYLEAGEHTLTLYSVAEPVAIGTLRFYVRQEQPTYLQYTQNNEQLGLKKGIGQNTYEAEDASKKSDSTLYAVEDRSSCKTTPYAPMDYIIRMYAKNTNAAPLVQALYGYHQAAETYTGEVQEAVGQIVPLTYPDAAVTTLNTSNLSAFKNRANDIVSYEGYKHQDGTNLAVSPYFTATVEGKTLPVYATPIFVCTTQKSELHSFASVDVEFSAREMVTIKLNVSDLVNVSSAQLFAHDEAILTQNGSELTLKASKHGNYTIVLNDDQAYAVTIFVRSYQDEDAQIAAYKAQYGEENVIVYEPGLHNISYLQMLNDNMVLYLKAGAVLLPEHTFDIMSDYAEENTVEEGASATNELLFSRNPVINGSYSNNLTIAGRGTLDMTQLDWHERRGIVFTCCENVTVDGVIMINPAEWSFITYRCENVRVTQSAVLGYRTNADGFAICNSIDVTVTDCFARTGDDAFEVKTLGGVDTAVSSNIAFSRCQAWASKARAFGVIGEIERDVSDVLFEDGIVIFRDATWDNDRIGSLIVLRECGSGNVSNITFRNMDIHYEAGRAILVGVYDSSLTAGTMENIVFENVTYNANEKSRVWKNSCANFEIILDNVVANGTLVTADNWSSYFTCDGTDMLVFD